MEKELIITDLIAHLKAIENTLINEGNKEVFNQHLLNVRNLLSLELSKTSPEVHAEYQKFLASFLNTNQ